MITIRNQKLFEELKKAPYWSTLFHERKGDSPICRDYRIPVLVGELDHIEVKPRGIYFYDRGVNNWNNSFVIRPEIGGKHERD